MSNVDLREFLTAYLAEVDEQLSVASARLLEIDASARRGEAHPRAVRDAFRAVHTIKGLSAMVGVEAAVTIAHRVEAILRLADRAGGRLEPDAVDVLLQGVRAIEHRVRQLAQGATPSPPPKALLDALDHLEPANADMAEPRAELHELDPVLAKKLAPFELETLSQGARGGRSAYRVDFTPSPARAERGLSINTVRERLGTIAEIVKVIPLAVPPTPEAPGGLSFAILLLTSVSSDEVAAAVGVEGESVRGLDGASTAAGVPFVPIDEDDGDVSIPQRRSIVRVDVGRLDDAMDHLSALIVTRSRLARAVADLTAAGANTRELREIMRDNARQLRDLRGAILRVRMVPVSEVLERIPLILRGMRRESGKQVRLHVDAGNAELDKGVAERLFPALVHLVRNAVDHAIEPPSERARRGKPEEGTLRIGCSQQSNTRLVLTVSDDGAGVDRARVAGRSARPIPPGDAALLEALCRAGLSTRDQATTTSGRGMGMDIVKRIVVDQLGGELSMVTEPGAGTTFTLRVPLTISIVDAFTLECRARRFVVPVSIVDEIMEIDPQAVRYGPLRDGSDRRRTGLIERRGETMPLVDLGAVLRVDAGDIAPHHALVVRRAGEPIAFGLDRVIGQQEAVVRPLLDPLVQVPGIAGATDLGDGKPTLVLDLVSLSATLSRREGDRAA